ncbi:sodium:calcium antiporter [Dechloromonas sp. ZY10]|uniref:sodium:calcium antiporter n=1 Tax=Dechloromonas aquae TaxID=2664436 RepID=UPI003528FA56
MSFPFSDLLTLCTAIAFAALGGEAFVRAVVGAASAWRIPSAIAATTLAAFATSSPEFTVSSIAALEGAPQIGLGDALGSNVLNLALIFALALLFGPIQAERRAFAGDFALALAIPALTGLLLLDGQLGRGDALLLLALFAGWILHKLRQARRERARSEARSDNEAHSQPVAGWTWYGLGGLALLVAAGHLFVGSASNLAATWGINSYIIGALIVAFGTSLPELATVLLARWRGHDDIGVGTLLGSNLFNGLCIVGVAAGLHPITIAAASVLPALFLGMLSVALLWPAANGWLQRWRALPLLAIYCLFILFTLAG